MNRRPIMAGNWKMHLLVVEAGSLVKSLLAGLEEDAGDAEVVVAPPFTSLYPIGQLIAGTPVALAAQDLHWEVSGAYTGEISPLMLRDVGCKYVIVGHSERRQFFGETNRSVNKKIRTALAEGLVPIMCVGETLKERKEEKTLEVVGQQVREGLRDVSRVEAGPVVIAYEPIWAIGTGETATPEQAQEVHAAIRAIVRDLYDDDLAGGMRIQYGGSVKPENVAELMKKKDIDGALVGGASLKAESFLGIVKYK